MQGEGETFFLPDIRKGFKTKTKLFSQKEKGRLSLLQEKESFVKEKQSFPFERKRELWWGRGAWSGRGGWDNKEVLEKLYISGIS